MVKLLFLPHCLNKNLSRKITKRGKDEGYEVYVVPGGSRVKRIIEEYISRTIDRIEGIEKIVGVACQEEVDLALRYFTEIELREKVFAVNLIDDGCKNTRVDLEKVLEIL